MRPARVLAALLTLLVLHAHAGLAGDVVMVEKVWVPDGWNEPEVEVQKRGPITAYKPSVPSGFKERTLGTTIGLESVTVHAATVPATPKSYILDIGKGQFKKVTSGTTLRIGKKLMKVIGDKDGVLYLQDTKTKRVMRYIQKDSQ